MRTSGNFSINKGFAPILIILGLLIIVGVSTGGLYLFQTSHKTKPATQTDSQIVKSSPSPSTTVVIQSPNINRSATNPTPEVVATPASQQSKSITIGNSVEYTNQVLNFSIKYPKSWILNECENSVMFGIEKNSQGRCNSGANATIMFYKWSTITDPTKNSYENAIEIYSNRKNEKKTINVNGNSGFRFYEILNACNGPCPPKGTIYVDYIFKDKDSSAFIIHYTQTPENENNLSVFEQLVSTFKFTN